MEDFPDHSQHFLGSSDQLKRTELAEMGRPSHVMSRNVRFPTDMPPLFPKARNMLANGTYDEKQTNAALAVVRKGDRVVEFGGGIGHMSAVIAKNTEAAQIHTFEANPALIPCIRRVHSENDLTNITVHHAILDKERGSRNFYVRRKFFESSTNREPLAGILHIADVPVLPAKQTIGALKPDVVICGIEGAEITLLPQLDLGGVRNAVVTLHPNRTGLEGVKTVFETLHGAGLIYTAKHSSAKVVTFTRAR
ncbi:FkbM family methyltransferase [Pseudooceanicola sp. MF1-13]|uniref:FkbM family methyltransferase n=1 Tax=Pseudooceanicola sp. MF1-13 TaxID=3379095 RepID=UPI003891676A